jgi:uncharacterized protein (TIGR00369 family)
MRYCDADIAGFNASPLYRTLGIRLLTCGNGNARSVLTPTPEVCWPTAGQPHGGILFTILDTSMAFAAISSAEDAVACATVDCSVQYPAPARDGPFECHVATVRSTGRTAFVRAELLDAQGVPVALAQATFRLSAARTDPAA